MRPVEGTARDFRSVSDSESDEDSDEASEDEASPAAGFAATFLVIGGMASVSLSESEEEDEEDDSDAARLLRFLFRFLGAAGFAGGGAMKITWRFGRKKFGWGFRSLVDDIYPRLEGLILQDKYISTIEGQNVGYNTKLRIQRCYILKGPILSDYKLSQ